MFSNINEIKEELKDKDVNQIIALLSNNNAIFTSSFGAEDQVITDIIAKKNLNIKIVTLDTGRLFPQTYDLWGETEDKYSIKIHGVNPDKKSIENYVNINGINAFYNSVDLRKECCKIRKINPLKEALNGYNVWITGLRKEQSTFRNALELVEYSEEFNLIKVNPIFDWSSKKVWEYIKINQVPYNKLHDQNYPSIGCACCTRAVQPNENPRLGRWWWEEESKKECGLHIKGE